LRGRGGRGVRRQGCGGALRWLQVRGGEDVGARLLQEQVHHGAVLRRASAVAVPGGDEEQGMAVLVPGAQQFGVFLQEGRERGGIALDRGFNRFFNQSHLGQSLLGRRQ